MATKSRPKPKAPPPKSQPSRPAPTPATQPLNEEEASEPHPLSSSMVDWCSWEQNEMTVVFQSGSEETYEVSQNVFEELLHAPSPGKWMWQKFQPHPFGV